MCVALWREQKPPHTDSRSSDVWEWNLASLPSNLTSQRRLARGFTLKCLVFISLQRLLPRHKRQPLSASVVSVGMALSEGSRPVFEAVDAGGWRLKGTFYICFNRRKKKPLGSRWVITGPGCNSVFPQVPSVCRLDAAHTHIHTHTREKCSKAEHRCDASGLVFRGARGRESHWRLLAMQIHAVLQRG